MKMFIFCLLFLSPAWAGNEKLPLWELGIGVLPFRTDNYRGSPQNKWFLFPLLAYIYRGKSIEAENGYIRGHIAKMGNLTLDLSFSLGLNVNSGSDRLRQGMEDLDPTFELGPIARFYLWASEDKNHFVNLEMPYRAVYTSDLSYIDHVGYYSIPYINYLSRGSEKTFGWTTEISLGIQYGSRGYHNHFYAVDSDDISPRRPFYHSTSGYSGSQLALIFSRRFGNIQTVPFIRYDYLDGAVYNESPLYKNPHFTMFGLNIIWFFASSSKDQQAPTMVK